MSWSLRGGVPLTGQLQVPGDKSVSHRALIFGALCDGATPVTGLLPSLDVGATARALRQLGAQIPEDLRGPVTVRGGALHEPRGVLDCGNSGTTLRLLAGLLASQPFFSVLDGDDSLRGRPMRRVVGPLRAMGAQVDGACDGRQAPLAIRGARPLRNQRFELAVASAQVASALLLAALGGEGTQEIALPGPARDHTERFLGALGAALSSEPLPGGGRLLRMAGGQALQARPLRVPGDLSSAAFLLAAALLVPGSELQIDGVGLNPTRTGLLDALARMGADLEIVPDPLDGPEPTGTLHVRASGLVATRIAGPEIPRLIDEIPVIAVLAAAADGVTEISDAAELRTKESDRLASTAGLLQALGVAVEVRPDGLRIEGRGGRPWAGLRAQSGGDHRIALAAAVAGLAGTGESRIDDTACVATSFPNFPALVARAGAAISVT